MTKNTQQTSETENSRKIKSTWILYLPYILLFTCIVEFILKCWLILMPQWNTFENNETNIHFALTCVTVFELIFLISAILNDFIFRIYTSFKWVDGLNITLFATSLFVIGYLFCYAGEIGFAIFNPFDTCRQLGLDKNFKPIENTNATSLTIDENEELKKDSCDRAVMFTTKLLAVDLLIISVFLPIHVFIMVNSWKFAALLRKRPVYDSDSYSSI